MVAKLSRPGQMREGQEIFLNKKSVRKPWVLPCLHGYFFLRKLHRETPRHFPVSQMVPSISPSALIMALNLIGTSSETLTEAASHGD